MLDLSLFIYSIFSLTLSTLLDSNSLAVFINYFTSDSKDLILLSLSYSSLGSILDSETSSSLSLST